MTRLIPFRALRPRRDLARQIASVPYDVVDTEEARALALGNPLSFLHVVRSEIDLPEGTHPYSDEVYAQAKRAFQELQSSGSMERDPDEAIYLYRQIMDGHAQVGIVTCCPVDEYDQDKIKKHEKTRPDKENDRTRHVMSIQANAGPVFLTYRGRDTINARVKPIVESQEPIYDFTAVDGIRHTIWKVKDPSPFLEEFAQVPVTYVADGHHRSASASRARAEMAKANPNHTGKEPYNRFLAVLFPADQLRILPYNRVVHDLNGHTSSAFLAALSAAFDATGPCSGTPSKRGEFAVYLDKQWHGFRAKESDLNQSDSVARLDAAILQDRVLRPLLGIEDPRTSDRISFVGGIRGIKELELRVNRRGSGVAFSLYALGMNQLMDVADDNKILPPKSTWFEPKLRSGLIVHTF